MLKIAAIRQRNVKYHIFCSHGNKEYKKDETKASFSYLRPTYYCASLEKNDKKCKAKF
jgi:hypothetical protein